MTGTDTEAVAEHVVIGGTVHVAVVTDRGGQLADTEVEGTSSYGAGFTRAARQDGLTVIEVNQPGLRAVSTWLCSR